ncbi:MAG: sirohydrochlorin cobaltochelatase [Myxococcales bacterium]|nr:sirohydrochlorin cobaltochelatase [Myxococcales bacterium]MCB9708975.1 sirohydrochlorin cobaltochelatase [Myxococcales bacterium]
MATSPTKVAILLVDHGSTREEANRCLPQIAELLQARIGADILVTYAHMELASPNIAQAIARCRKSGITDMVVHPYMLAPGRHASTDIPNLVADAAYPGLKVRITDALGVHPALVDAIMDRCGVVP